MKCAMTVHTPHTPLWRRVLSLPKTQLGWWSLGFLAEHGLIVFAFGAVAGVLNAAGLPNMAGHPWLIALTLFVVGAPALAGITTGLFAVIRRAERSIAVVAPLLLVILFLLAEALMPH